MPPKKKTKPAKPKPDGYVFGRPTKYKKEYCQMLVDHMSKGLSFESFAAILHTSKVTLYAWTNKHPDFMNAKKEATDRCRLWWESVGTKGMLGQIPNFNATVWIFNQKNRFGWRDRQDIEHTTEGGKAFEIIINDYRSKSQKDD